MVDCSISGSSGTSHWFYCKHRLEEVKLFEEGWQQGSNNLIPNVEKTKELVIHFRRTLTHPMDSNPPSCSLPCRTVRLHDSLHQTSVPQVSYLPVNPPMSSCFCLLCAILHKIFLHIASGVFISTAFASPTCFELPLSFHCCWSLYTVLFRPELRHFTQRCIFNAMHKWQKLSNLIGILVNWGSLLNVPEKPLSAARSPAVTFLL